MIEYLNSGTITTQIGFYKEIYKVMGLAQKLFGTHSEHELKEYIQLLIRLRVTENLMAG